MPSRSMLPSSGIGTPQATDPETLTRLFGRSDDLLALWIAEPYVPLASAVVSALQRRAAGGWYGYERRPPEVVEAFWDWMGRRHGWDGTDLHAVVSSSVGTSIGVFIDLYTSPGGAVILQPPVFTDFKPLITSAGRTPLRNPLQLDAGTYRIDVDDLAAKAGDARMMILCNPHNPVGRVWTAEELAQVVAICRHHDVFVLADEIHADLVLDGAAFVPFATVAAGSGLRWAATHGPIKTFGLAGVCDTLVVTDDGDIAGAFEAVSSRLHLTRNNVFGIAAFEAAYREGGSWLDELLALVADNLQILRTGLPDGIRLVEPEGTYLAWLDLRDLGLDVPELSRWLAEEAGLALSPGHWFGRQGAGFARMTVAAPAPVVEEAVDRLRGAVARLTG